MGPFAVSIKSLTLPLIDRYLFRQLLIPTILATVALAAIGILSQSLSALDVLVDERQGLVVFAKVALLAMPQLMVIVLPVAILVAGLAALNRLHTEQEIVICFAGGMSRWRVIAPAVRLSLLAALASLVLSLWIQPYCFRILRQTLQDVRADLAATLIKPGRFTHPAPGVTVYAQSVGEDGLIRNLFIDIVNTKGRDTTLTAREGRFQTRGGKPMLILRSGASQEISPAGVLNFLAFDQYPFDLRPFVANDRAVQYKLSDRYPHELFFPDYGGAWERANAGKLAAEGHSRFAAALYNPAFMMLALAAVIGGPFSKPGYALRIAAAAGVALVVRTLGFAVQAAAGAQPSLDAAQYLIPIATALAAAAMIFVRTTRARTRSPAQTAIGARDIAYGVST